LPTSKNWISHYDLIKGGTLLFQMSAVPNRNRGIKKEDAPFSFSER